MRGPDPIAAHSPGRRSPVTQGVSASGSSALGESPNSLPGVHSPCAGESFPEPMSMHRANGASISVRPRSPKRVVTDAMILLVMSVIASMCVSSSSLVRSNIS